MNAKGDDDLNKEEAIERIVQWYVSDTIGFVDLVLDDSEIDPHYSAVTLCDRIKLYLEYIKLTTGADSTVSEFLDESGYDADSINLIERKRADESKYYRRSGMGDN